MDSIIIAKALREANYNNISFRNRFKNQQEAPKWKSHISSSKQQYCHLLQL